LTQLIQLGLIWLIALTSRAQIPEFVQRDKRANVDLIKAYANLSDRMLRNLVEEAHKEKIRVVIDQWERNGSPGPGANRN